MKYPELIIWAKNAVVGDAIIVDDCNKVNSVRHIIQSRQGFYMASNRDGYGNYHIRILDFPRGPWSRKRIRTTPATEGERKGEEANKMLYLGIDPGMTGCIATLQGNTITWAKMPVIAKKKGGHDYDVAGINRAILNILSQNKGNQFFAAVERVSIFPVSKKNRANPTHEKQTSMSANSKQFFCAGLLHGILTAHNIPFIEVHVISWKKKILEGLGGDKSLAVKYINGRFPDLRITDLPKYVQTGLADAVCIGLYAKLIHLGEK